MSSTTPKQAMVTPSSFLSSKVGFGKYSNETISQILKNRPSYCAALISHGWIHSFDMSSKTQEVKLAHKITLRNTILHHYPQFLKLVPTPFQDACRLVLADATCDSTEQEDTTESDEETESDYQPASSTEEETETEVSEGDEDVKMKSNKPSNKARVIKTGYKRPTNVVKNDDVYTDEEETDTFDEEDTENEDDTKQVQFDEEEHIIQPKSAQNENDEWCQIDGIVDHQYHPDESTWCYFVKWTGYDATENQWVTEADVSPDMLAVYWKSLYLHVIGQYQALYKDFQELTGCYKSTRSQLMNLKDTINNLNQVLNQAEAQNQLFSHSIENLHKSMITYSLQNSQLREQNTYLLSHVQSLEEQLKESKASQAFGQDEQARNVSVSPVKELEQQLTSELRRSKRLKRKTVHYGEYEY